jgi:hypothetical protein
MANDDVEIVRRGYWARTTATSTATLTLARRPDLRARTFVLQLVQL